VVEVYGDNDLSTYSGKALPGLLEKKAKIKAAMGHSPDFAVSLLAAWWGTTYRPSVGFGVRTA
jgi:hypothetical protein